LFRPFVALGLDHLSFYSQGRKCLAFCGSGWLVWVKVASVGVTAVLYRSAFATVYTSNKIAEYYANGELIFDFLKRELLFLKNSAKTT
jgi:hypothetical protein